MSERRQQERRVLQVPVTENRRAGDRRRGDRRLAARAPLDLWVEEVKGDELYFRRTGNVSRGGISFEQAIPHRVGTRVRLRFALPTGAVIDVAAEVVSASVDDTLGMGLRFVDVDAASAVAIAAFVDDEQPASL